MKVERSLLKSASGAIKLKCTGRNEHEGSGQNWWKKRKYMHRQGKVYLLQACWLCVCQDQAF
eukprot:scaffold245365_cov15-Tisochrysis_lutea.AAC.1